MLNLMKNRINELGITATEEHFNTVIERTTDMLQTQTAILEIIEGAVDSDTARYTVRITNLTGHKFPSGYPSRRAYIEFVATNDDGDVIFHSGKLMPNFEVQGQNPTYEPHYDLITDGANQVQIYEMVMGDVNGNETTVLERADHPIKDNRLPPLGFTVNHASYDTMRIAGVPTTDLNFNRINAQEGSGTDDVRYHIPLNGATGNIHITARLMYQSVPPKWNAEMFAVDHPVINAFEQMYWQEGAVPVQVAMDEANTLVAGMNEIKGFFHVSPNPTINGTVTLDAGNDELLQIKIYTLDGRLIRTYEGTSNKRNVQLPETAGTYLLDVTTSRGRRVEKVLRR